MAGGIREKRGVNEKTKAPFESSDSPEASSRYISRTRSRTGGEYQSYLSIDDNFL
jgi:hypothetical protein